MDLWGPVIVEGNSKQYIQYKRVYTHIHTIVIHLTIKKHIELYLTLFLTFNCTKSSGFIGVLIFAKYFVLGEGSVIPPLMTRSFNSHYTSSLRINSKGRWRFGVEPLKLWHALHGGNPHGRRESIMLS